MDNVTHSLIGLAVGDAVYRVYARRARAPKQPNEAERARPWFWGVSALANNFPDLDLVLAPLTRPRKLGYLLQHRGYTHTLVAAPLQAALVLGLAWLLWRAGKARRARGPASKLPWSWLAALAVAGVALHVGFDYLNSYGVHPFWPFDRSWYFGDSVFIVEPVIWLTLLPALIFNATTSRGRYPLAGVFALGLGLCLFSGFIPWQIAIVLALASAWLLGLAWKLKPAARIAAALTLCASWLAVSGLAQARAREAVHDVLARDFPHSRALDVALSPYPANPLCWMVLTAERDGENFIARQGVYASAPSFLAAAECPELRAPQAHSFPRRPVPGPSTPRLLWQNEFQAPVRELLQLRARYCAADAVLRFTRVPGWVERGDGEALLGDLRFDQGKRAGFAKVELSASDECPRSVPGWEWPRRDLLGN